MDSRSNTPYRWKPSNMRDDIDRWYEELSFEPEVAFVVMARCGAEVTELDKPFACPLPGHRKTRSSAELRLNRNKRVMFHDLHAVEGDNNQWFTLPEVYAACCNPSNRKRRVQRLTRGEQAIWWIRAMVECGIVEAPPPPEGKLELPEDTLPDARIVYEGFCFRLQLGGLYEQGQKATPFAKRFAMRWLGIGKIKFRTGFDWLLNHGYVVGGETKWNSELYELGVSI